jgi:hypothetical protein
MLRATGHRSAPLSHLSMSISTYDPGARSEPLEAMGSPRRHRMKVTDWRPMQNGQDIPAACLSWRELSITDALVRPKGRYALPQGYLGQLEESLDEADDRYQREVERLSSEAP